MDMCVPILYLQNGYWIWCKGYQSSAIKRFTFICCVGYIAPPLSPAGMPPRVLCITLFRKYNRRQGAAHLTCVQLELVSNHKSVVLSVMSDLCFVEGKIVKPLQELQNCSVSTTAQNMVIVIRMQNAT
jgi:hypothetical protein